MTAAVGRYVLAGNAHSEAWLPSIRSSIDSSPQHHKMSRIDRELPMPNVTKFSDFNQAQATLLHCFNRLTRYQQSSEHINIDHDERMDRERQDCRQWLDKWEKVFTEFLSTSMMGADPDFVTQCRVLKANHLACSILASDASEPFSSSPKPDHDFAAIVDLASAVLQSRHIETSPVSAACSSRAKPTTPGLDVRDPLRLVVARCPHPRFRSRANDLLKAWDR